MRVLFCALFAVVTFSAHSQYWFGPKVGYHYTIHDYQDPNYRKDYKVSNDHNFEAGIAVTYTASEKYAVHGELFFERQGSRVRNKKDKLFIDSQTDYNYLSFPILLRVSMGHQPVHWYLNGGPKLSYWLGGKGKVSYSDLIEFDDEVLDDDDFHNYTVVFNRAKAEGVDNDKYYVPEANRLLYSLTVGGGFYLDLANGARLMLDARYNWGHSNMGFNDDPINEDGRTILFNAMDAPEKGYQENYEYSYNTMSFSIAYMFEYNTDFKRKGSSTSSESKNTKKSAKKKKKQ